MASSTGACNHQELLEVDFLEMDFDADQEIFSISCSRAGCTEGSLIVVSVDVLLDYELDLKLGECTCCKAQVPIKCENYLLHKSFQHLDDNATEEQEEENGGSFVVE